MDNTLTPQQEERDACMAIIMDEWMRSQGSSVTEVVNRITDRIMARGPIPQRRFMGVPLEEIPHFNAFADGARAGTGNDNTR